MNKINDEMLNRYIDNELDSEELSELKTELEKNSDAVTRLKALQTVDNSLRQMQNDLAPQSFTEKLMSKIQSVAQSAKPKVSYFFISIISIFSVGIVSLLIFAIEGMKTEDAKSNLDPVFQQVKEFAGKNLGFIEIMFKTNTILLVGAMLAVIMLFTAYFTFESHKNFKNKLNSISH